MTQIGFDRVTAVYMSMVGGGALWLGTIPGILYMEKFGRRFWVSYPADDQGQLLISANFQANLNLPGFFIGLVLIGVSYTFNLATQQTATVGLYITGLILYMGFYGTYACLTWVIPSEVYPTYLRSYGMTSSTAMINLVSDCPNIQRDRPCLSRIIRAISSYHTISPACRKP
jgi:hypothetical protein